MDSTGEAYLRDWIRKHSREVADQQREGFYSGQWPVSGVDVCRDEDRPHTIQAKIT